MTEHRSSPSPSDDDGLNDGLRDAQTRTKDRIPDMESSASDERRLASGPQTASVVARQALLMIAIFDAYADST
jgi:hypothetical protein